MYAELEVPAEQGVFVDIRTQDTERLWLRGGFPRSLLAGDEAESFDWRRRYIHNVCRRDFTAINASLSPAAVDDFLIRLAVTQGEEFTMDKSRVDERALLDHLQEIGLVRRLRPWSSNTLKRLKQHPKMYLRDSGLLHAFLKRRKLEELDAIQIGHSWEGFCIENIVNAAERAGAEPFFYRDEDKDEIDLLLEYPGQRRVAMEMKCSPENTSIGFFKAVEKAGAQRAFVVSPVEKSYDKGSYRVMTLSDMTVLCEDPGNLFVAL